MSETQKLTIIFSSVFFYPTGLYWYLRYKDSTDEDLANISKISIMITLLLTTVYFLSFVMFIFYFAHHQPFHHLNCTSYLFSSQAYINVPQFTSHLLLELRN